MMQLRNSEIILDIELPVRNVVLHAPRRGSLAESVRCDIESDTLAIAIAPVCAPIRRIGKQTGVFKVGQRAGGLGDPRKR